MPKGTGAAAVESYWTGGNLRFAEKVSGNNKQVQFKIDTVFIGGTTTNTVSFDTSGATFTMAGVTLATAGLTSTSNLTFSATAAAIRGVSGLSSSSAAGTSKTFAIQATNSSTAYEDVIAIVNSTGGGIKLRFFNTTGGTSQIPTIGSATSGDGGFIDKLNALTTGLIGLGLIAT